MDLIEMVKKDKSECSIQIGFISWVRMFYPMGRNLICHIPNGGKRDAKEAAIFKNMGVLAGMPDVVCFIPVRPYHGLFIEFKKSGAFLSQRQSDVKRDLEAYGYAYGIARSTEEAIEIFKRYIGKSLIVSGE